MSNAMYEKELPAVNVLICIGNDHISEPLYQYFSRSGASHTVVCKNQFEINNAIYDTHYDLVIMEQNMPSIKGFALYQNLLHRKKISVQTQVLFLMDEPTQAEVIKAKKLGLKNILVPPFTLKSVSDRAKFLFAKQERENTMIALATKRAAAKKKAEARKAAIAARAATINVPTGQTATGHPYGMLQKLTNRDLVTAR